MFLALRCRGNSWTRLPAARSGRLFGRFRVWNKKPQRCFAGVLAGKADGGNGSPREPVPTDPLSSEEQSVVRPGRSPGLRGVNPAYSGASAAASHRLPYSPLRRAVEGAPGRANIQLSKWQMTLPEPRRRVNGGFAGLLPSWFFAASQRLSRGRGNYRHRRFVACHPELDSGSVGVPRRATMTGRSALDTGTGFGRDG